MKKIVLSLVCLGLLAACSSDNGAKVQNGNETVFISQNSRYTKQDHFETMKNNDYTAIIGNQIVKKIAELEGVDMEAVNKEADQRLQEMSETYGDYYTQLEQYYGGKENLKANLIASVSAEKLTYQYFDLNFDTLVNENKPVKMQLAYFDTKESAEAALEAINNGSTFDIAVLENGYKTDASPKIYLDGDALALEVKTYINADEKTGVSQIITAAVNTTDADGNTVTTTRYYLINVIDRDVNNFKEDFLEVLYTNFDTKESLNHFFAKHDIEFYDQRTYDLLSATYEALK